VCKGFRITETEDFIEREFDSEISLYFRMIKIRLTLTEEGEATGEFF